MPDDLQTGFTYKEYVDDRLAFVRKVLGIVSFQLALTMTIAMLASSYDVFGMWVSQLWVQIVSLVLLILTIIPLVFLHKSVPINYLLLLLVTCCESVAVAAWTAMFTPESVLLSIFVLSATVLSLFTATLFTPRWEWLIGFMIGGLILSCIGQLIMMIVWLTRGFLTDGWFVFYGICGVILTGIYVMIDLIMVMIPEGGFSMDDYILASLMLYVDIIRMFIYILMIFGKSK